MSPWTGVYPPPPEFAFLINEKCFPKTGSLSPLLGKVEPVKGGCMYLEALRAILFVRILPPEKQTITKGILVNKLCLTSLCKNIFNGCKHLKPLYH